jgi:hypothetical protein
MSVRIDTGPEVSAEKQSPPLPSLRAHYSRFSNYLIRNRQRTCKYTITVQFTDLEKLLSHRKHGDGGDCFPVETSSRKPNPVRDEILLPSLRPTTAVLIIIGKYVYHLVSSRGHPIYCVLFLVRES